MLQRLFFSVIAGKLTSLSSQALVENQSRFMDLADRYFNTYVREAKKDLDLTGDEIIRSVQPVTEALGRYQDKLAQMEKDRERAFGSLSARLVDMARAQSDLQKETGNLAKALRVPHVRGRWGEITLKRVAELSGMIDRCDFTEQPGALTGKSPLRPDMVVHLPGSRYIVVDAKVPLNSYLDSLEAETEGAKKQCLEHHSRQLAGHVATLSSKKYWQLFSPSPEFVVLFVPGENYFSAALSVNPGLIEAAVRRGVIIATPTTLISLLKAVAYGWRQEAGIENARKISHLGSELYERLSAMAGSMNQLGRDIERCGATFNRTVGSLEKRVLVSARKLSELGASQNPEESLPEIETTLIQSREINPEESSS